MHGAIVRTRGAARTPSVELCPPATAPCLRLAMTSQPSAPDSVLSASLSEDDEHPKGCYLRVVDGVPWLWGFRCDDEHRWPPGATVVLGASREG